MVSLPVGSCVTVNIVVTPTASATFTNPAPVAPTDATPGDNTASATATVLGMDHVNNIDSYILTDLNAPSVLEFDAFGLATVPPVPPVPFATAHAGTAPEGTAISPNGRIAYVGNLNSNYVTVIDLTFNDKIAR